MRRHDATLPLFPDIEEPADARLRDLPKMSTTLLEFASPLFGDDDDLTADELRGILAVAEVAWNATGDAPWTDPDLCARVRRQIGAEQGVLVGECLRFLVERRRTLFGDDPRTVGPLEVVADQGLPARVRVSVLDSPSVRAYVDGPEPPDCRAGLHPSFAAFVRSRRLDARFVRLGIPNPFPGDGSFVRRRLRLGWRAETGDWDAPELMELMRGGAAPADPPGSEAFIDAHLPLLQEVETAVVCVARALPRAPCDRDVREAYRAIRRRPDDCGDDPIVSVVWQALALALARRAWSAAQVEAALHVLERSVRRHERWPGGTDYVAFLSMTIPAAT